MFFLKLPGIPQSWRTSAGVINLTSVLAVACGLLTFTDWAAQSIAPEQHLLVPFTSRATAAALFALLGFSLWDFGCRAPTRMRNATVRVVALGVVFVSMASLAAFVFPENVTRSGILRPGHVIAAAQATMSPAAALGFVMIGSALFWLPSDSLWARRAAQCLLLGTLFTASMAVANYCYGTKPHFAIEPFTSMPLPMALTFLALSIGMLYSRADFELMAPLRSHRMGGVLARTSLPGIAASPLLLGWFFLKGEQLEFYGFESAVAVHAVAMVAVLARVLWYSARTLNDLDAQHERAQQKGRDLLILSEIDPLTGVLNRRSLNDRLEREWARSLRSKYSLACIMVDIDKFKHINDTYGHTIGDTVIKLTAASLAQHCRPADIIARFGGEEFCIVLPETSEQGAYHLAERLRTVIADTQIVCGESTLGFTASFGVADCNALRDQFDTLVDRADQALLIAKRTGRDRVVMASGHQHSHRPGRSDLARNT